MSFAEDTASPQLVSGGFWASALAGGRSDGGLADSRGVDTPATVPSVTAGPPDGRGRPFRICWIRFAAKAC